MSVKTFVICGLLAAAGNCASGAWLRFRSPHFDLITNCEPGAGAEALRRFEEIRQVLDPDARRASSAPPVAIFLFRTERDFRPYVAAGAESLAGYYAPGADRDYIALRDTGDDLRRTIFHEYVHLFLKRSGAEPPLWLNEGTAELYSTLRVSGPNAVAGSPIPAHLRMLRASKLMPLGELFGMTRDSVRRGGLARRSAFYAQSWALVHMLYTEARYAGGRPEFIRRASAGEQADSAFVAVFGRPLSEARLDLAAHIERDRFPEIMFPVAPLRSIPNEPAERMRDVDAELALADLLVAVDRVAEATEQVRDLLPLHNESPTVHERMGDLLLARNDRAGALEEYERSIALGAAHARAYYEASALLRERARDLDRAAAYARHAIKLDPTYADARALLGLLYLGSGRDGEAAREFEAAAKLAPRKLWIWENLAVARYNLGQREEAVAAARQARAMAATPEEVTMSEAALRLVETPGRAGEGERGANTRVPTSWENAKGDSWIEGSLARLDCLGTDARFHVATAERDIALYVRDPARVVLEGAGGAAMELTCGEWKTRPHVRVEFTSRPDARLQTAGDVTRIQFK